MEVNEQRLRRSVLENCLSFWRATSAEAGSACWNSFDRRVEVFTIVGRGV